MCIRGAHLEDGAEHDAAHLSWSRRQFLRGLAMAGGAISLGAAGVPVSAASSRSLERALLNSDPDKVFVLIQLAGGNDGLNTVLPLGNDLYHRARGGLAISDVQAIDLGGGVGLHPSLAAWESLYKDGRLGIVQNVGYENPALSHFVSTDIWMSGQAEAEPSGTGWPGRYLEHAHPDYLATPPDSPVALQVGASGSMLFQGNAGSMGVTFPSTSALTRLAQGGAVYDTEDVPDGILGQELAFVRNISNHSFGHAESIKDAYDTGRNTRSYPGGNSLSDSLRTVARLIRGGLGARVYHVSLGGFDTHANQQGTHATLLRRLGDATAAFMADLAADGHSEHVVAMTFSEFGRRIRANGSAGTDHGT
ncbi:MAG: DUF1501 domain-containing protein, partial [Rhodothermales bacterium]|nr:DUF1501 domain-containing protein [Rhodothermales bacterium]